MRLANLVVAAALLVTPIALANQDVENIGPDYVKSNGTAPDPKRTPKIQAPEQVAAGEWFDVRISVGEEKLHPSVQNQHVRYISLEADGVEISRIYLHPTMSKPQVTFTVALPDNRLFDEEGNLRGRRDRVVTLRAVQAPTDTAEWWSETKIKVKAKK